MWRIILCLLSCDLLYVSIIQKFKDIHGKDGLDLLIVNLCGSVGVNKRNVLESRGVLGEWRVLIE